MECRYSCLPQFLWLVDNSCLIWLARSYLESNTLVTVLIFAAYRARLCTEKTHMHLWLPERLTRNNWKGNIAFRCRSRFNKTCSVRGETTYSKQTFIKSVPFFLLCFILCFVLCFCFYFSFNTVTAESFHREMESHFKWFHFVGSSSPKSNWNIPLVPYHPHVLSGLSG